MSESWPIPEPEEETLLPAPLYLSYVKPTHLTRVRTHLFL